MVPAKGSGKEEKSSSVAAKYGFIVYAVCLLIWGIYSFSVKGHSEAQMYILLIGSSIYFWFTAVEKRKRTNKRF
ncbi:hypothetical protein CN918_30940 [Priestia megaterium]|nr:hypothetical protein CN918_30940 [Priestia megaterium]